MGAVLSVAVAIGVPLGVSFAIGRAVHHNDGWYRDLKKPTWTPPSWVFGPVWTILYSCMGLSSWMVWKQGAPWLPLTLYGIQLALNFAWSPLFFGKHDTGAALADIIGLLGVLTATIVEFGKVDQGAAMLLLPYLGWTALAAALNYTIWQDNTIEGGKVAPKLSPEEANDEAAAAANRDLLSEAEALTQQPVIT